MKKNFLPAALAAILLASCKKDNAASPPPAPQEPAPQIASIKQTISFGNAVNITKNFLYDAENRLKEIKHTGSGSQNVNEKYNYTGNLVQYRNFEGTTEITNRAADYTLNNDGQVVKQVIPLSNSTIIYEYNNAGYIKRLNYNLNGNETDYDIYYYSGNNVLDSITTFAINGAKKAGQAFTYEAGSKNTTGNENTGLKMLGKNQAAPLKSKAVFFFNNSGMRYKNAQHNYTYTYGSNGRIEKLIHTYTSYLNGAPQQTIIQEELEYTYKQ
jgi:hypothetical protein